MTLGLTGKVAPRRYNVPCTVYTLDRDDNLTQVFTGWCRVQERGSASIVDAELDALSAGNIRTKIALGAPVSLLSSVNGKPSVIRLGDGREYIVVLWSVSENGSELVAYCETESV